jgi:hypothetical protein
MQQQQPAISFSTGTAAPAAKRFGGWNGFVAQGAAIILSGFSAGELNGPSSGIYRPPYSSGVPSISRPYKY